MRITFWTQDVEGRNTAVRMIRDAVLDAAEAHEGNHAMHVDFFIDRRRRRP